MTYPEIIYNYRMQHKLTKREFAKLMGVTMVTLRLWMLGRTPRDIKQYELKQMEKELEGNQK